MLQWIRWWGLGLFAGLVLLILLGTNPLIKRSIEFVGTQAVGARVELDSVSWRWSGPSLTLERLQVTNPREPMRNMMEAGRMEFALDGFALFRRQFIAENLAVEGLRFNTERRRSGAIDGRLFSRKRKDEPGEESGFDITRLLPGVQMPDPGALVASGRERVNSELDRMDGEAEAIEQGWQEHIQALPDSATVDAYRERWRAVQQLDSLRRAAGARELTRDIDRDLDTIRRLDNRLQDDRRELRGINTRARNLPREEADRLLGAAGLDAGLEGITGEIMGEQLTGWVEQGLTAYQLAATHMAGRKTEKPPRPPRGEGETIRFPEEQPLPRFLIKRAALDGVARIAGQSIGFSGEIRSITTEPAIWGQPMTLRIDGSNEAGASLQVTGNFDHRGEPGRDRLDFALRQLRLNDATLSGSNRFPIVLQQGLADITGNLTVSEGRLDSAVDTRVRNSRFTAGSDDASSTLQRLGRAIEQVSSFQLNLRVGGTPTRPEIGLRSDLDRIIANAIGAEVRAELAQSRAELESRIRAEVTPQLDAIAAHEQALEEYRQQIEARRQALRDIRP